jgi:hypothetical protein
LEDGIMPPVLGDVPLTSITPVVVPPVFGWVLDVPVTPLDRFWDPDAHAAVLAREQEDLEVHRADRQVTRRQIESILLELEKARHAERLARGTVKQRPTRDNRVLLDAAVCNRTLLETELAEAAR